jgi:hypothetical protein
MAISGIIQFHASSGAPSHPWQLDPFVANSGTEWNRIGFFNTAGPGSFVTINTYQNKTYTVNESGVAPNSTINSQSGQLTNLKYVSSSTVNPNSSGAVNCNTITEPDATLRIRFTEPSGIAVTVQNIYFKCVALNASSGVANEDTVQSGITVQVFEVGKDTTWTKVSNDAASNSLTLDNRAGSSIIHDFHLGISVSPITTGEKKNFAFLMKLEYI